MEDDGPIAHRSPDLAQRLHAAAVDAVLTVGVMFAAIVFCGCAFSFGTRNDLIPKAAVPLAATAGALLFALITSSHRDGTTLGERSAKLMRVGIDGRPATDRDTWRYYWPTLWLLVGVAVLFVVLVINPPRRPNTPMLIDALVARTWLVGLPTVLPPLAAYVRRRFKGDGTRLVLAPRPAPVEPTGHGFEVVVAQLDALDAEPSEASERS